MARAKLICGVDEAGRGPLAGPVYAAAVILSARRKIDGLADSKVLTARKRDTLQHTIKTKCAAWAVACATVEEIDDLNILGATLLAMRRAVEALAIEPHEVWIDGNQAPNLPLPCRTVVGGDATVPAISAASILAKTARDHAMLLLDARFPEYGFAANKGYPTPAHLAVLESIGPCPVHRRSFEPVRLALAAPGRKPQPELF